MEDLLRLGVDYSRRLGASYAEIRYQSDSTLALLLKNGVLEVFNSYRLEGMAIRVIVNGSLGFASTNKLQTNSIRNAVASAISLAKATSGLAKPPVRMSEELPNNDRVEIKPRIKFENVELEAAVELLKDADDAAVGCAEKRSVKMASRILEAEMSGCEKYVINSDGASIRTTLPRTSLTYTLVGVHPQKGSAMRVSTSGESKGWEAMERWDIVKLMTEEGETMGKVLDQGISSPRDNVDVLIGSEIVGLICHESSGHPGEADRILGREAAQAGESYLSTDSIGMEVGSPVVNVVDDPTVPNSYGFYLYDDEGIKARKRYLIKEGRIAEFLQNRETAAYLGTKSNGAARASQYDREPIIRMANTYLQPGDMSFDELIEDIEEGIFMNNFTEWNIDDRRFNQKYTGFESYLIENGELKSPVRNPIIEMTTIGLYKSVDAVGDDLRFYGASCGKGDPMQGIPVWTGGPTIRLRGVKVGCA